MNIFWILEVYMQSWATRKKQYNIYKHNIPFWDKIRLLFAKSIYTQGTDGCKVFRLRWKVIQNKYYLMEEIDSDEQQKQENEWATNKRNEKSNKNRIDEIERIGSNENQG